MDQALLAAVTPYILIFGSFTYLFLKIKHVGRTFTRVYGFIYVLIAFVFTTMVYLSSFNKVFVYKMAGFPPPIGITYTIDNLNAFLAFLSSILFLLIYPLAKNYVDDTEYFYAMLLALESGMIGTLYTGDIFNMFVMMELLLIATYSLIASKRTASSYKAAFKYAMVAGVSGMIFFLSAVLYYNVLGTLNIGHGGAILDGLVAGIGKSSAPLLGISIVLLIILWTMMVETAISPLHFWLPDAYSNAPPPVAGLLAGLSEGIGFYVLLRLYYVLLKGFTIDASYTLLILGILTIFVGGFGMIYSRDLLKIISYSVILDAGYIAIALSLGGSGVFIVLSYILAHAIVKPLLFIVSGYIVYSRGSSDLDMLNGVLRNNPLLSAGFLVGAMAVIGIPPTILFQAKLQLYVSVLNNIVSGSYVFLAPFIAMLLGSVMAIAGFSRALYPMLFKPGEGIVKPRGYTVFFVTLFMTLVIVLGLIYSVLYSDVIVYAGNSILAGRDKYIGEIMKMLGGI